MITGIAVLLISCFMLLINNHDTQIFQRSKDGWSGANHNLGIATFHFAPFVILFTIGQAWVKNGHLVPKTSDKALRHLWSQGNLRNKQNSCLALVQGPLDNLQVNLRLPTSCNPLKEEGRLMTANRTDNRITRLPLFWIQLQRLTCLNAFKISSRALNFLLDYGHRTLFDKEVDLLPRVGL